MRNSLQRHGLNIFPKYNKKTLLLIERTESLEKLLRNGKNFASSNQTED